MLTKVADCSMLILSKCRYCQLFKGDVVPETIPISKFKAACLSLLRQVKRTGKTILVTRKGEPIALVTPPPLRPLPRNPESWLGTMRTSISIKGDIISPVLDESDWEALQD